MKRDIAIICAGCGKEIDPLAERFYVCPQCGPTHPKCRCHHWGSSD